MQQVRQHFYVSCWHFSKCESNAMWQLYSHVHKGVAVRTTLGRLKRSIRGFGGRIYVGRIDYSETAANYDSMLGRLFLKRKAFAYEKEFRAVIVGDSVDALDGVTVDVDPHDLILSIHLSPFCEQWLRNLVQKLLIRYGYRIEIRGGDEHPVF